MSCSRHAAWYYAAIALTMPLVAGACLLLCGCSTPATMADSVPSLSTDREDTALAKKVRNDPFPSASECGVASAPTKSR
jgi:hypothetical protein